MERRPDPRRRLCIGLTGQFASRRLLRGRYHLIEGCGGSKHMAFYVYGTGRTSRRSTGVAARSATRVAAIQGRGRAHRTDGGTVRTPRRPKRCGPRHDGSPISMPTGRSGLSTPASPARRPDHGDGTTRLRNAVLNLAAYLKDRAGRAGTLSAITGDVPATSRRRHATNTAASSPEPKSGRPSARRSLATSTTSRSTGASSSTTTLPRTRTGYELRSSRPKSGAH